MRSVFSGGGGGSSGRSQDFPNQPEEPLPFEIEPVDVFTWTFIPVYYPDRFTQTKAREFNRNSSQCEGENVSVKKVKNREFHVSGIVLGRQISVFNDLQDHNDPVNLISPITPDGGIECYVKNAEVGEINGYDPMEGQWQFKYTIDLVSTGRDEHDTGENAIVSEIMSAENFEETVDDAVETGIEFAGEIDDTLFG